MASYIQEIKWNGEDLEVHFDFTKGYEAKLWGAPEDCYPGCGDEWEIYHAYYKGVDVLPLLDVDVVLYELKEVGDDDDPF